MKPILNSIQSALPAILAGVVMLASQNVALAQHRGGGGGGGRSSASHGGFSAPRAGAQSFAGRGSVGPAFSGQRGFSGARGFERGGVVRSFGPRGGLYFGYGLGYGVPYGYAYGPGYAYNPCQAGAYDQYGNWIPSPGCYAAQPQYQGPPPSYGVNPQQYPPQQNYNQQGYPPPDYDPNQQQYPPAQNPNQRPPYNQ
jgi:hypothetical protein